MYCLCLHNSGKVVSFGPYYRCWPKNHHINYEHFCMCQEILHPLPLCVSLRKMLFDTPEEDANYNPLPEERPGGFAWGEGQRFEG